MLSVDAYAYKSRISKYHPMLKVSLFFMNLLAVSFSDGRLSVWVSWTIAVLLTLYTSNLGIKRLLKWYSVPLTFVMIGLIPIMIDLVPETTIVQGWSLGSIASYKFVTSTTHVDQALRLLTKSMTAIAWMFFLISTTPLNDILFAFKRLKLPQIICDLMQLMYRFIFVLLDSASTIHFSQRSRYGYRSYKNGFRSFAFLCKNVLNQAFKHMETLRLSLISRGFKKHLLVVDRTYTCPPFFCILSLCITGITLWVTCLGG